MKKNDLPKIISTHIDHRKFNFDIVFTERQGHATELAKVAMTQNVDAAIAVGGDGSANEVATALVGTKVALGIVPCGSGNGMARHLGIPVDLHKSLATINAFNIDIIDTYKVNHHFALGTFGIGFDGHIAHLFNQSSKRGYSTYVKLVLTEFYKYKPKQYRLFFNGQPHHVEAFLLTIANSSQFGNNALIAPLADEQDGLLDISIVKPFPLWKAPALINRLMKNTLMKSKYFTGYQTDSIKVENNSILPAHIDGEPLTFSENIEINVVPKSLLVIS
ncbi:MAG: hypothetical protein RIQ89_1015 [Bacteroidota bacterium]